MEHILREPAVLVTAIVSALAIFGVDAANIEEDLANVIQFVSLLVGGFIIRQRVTPTRKLENPPVT